MSCNGAGYLSGNMLVRFPFEDGQTIPLRDEEISDEAQILLDRCFVDAGFYSKTVSAEGSDWPSIGRFDYVYDKYANRMQLGFYVRAFGRDFRKVAIASSTRFPIINGEEEWGSYVITVSSEGIRDFCRFCEGNGIPSPISLSSPPATGSSSPSWQDGEYWFRVCPRCVTFSPAQVSSIMVFDGVRKKSEGPHFVLNGDVSLKQGNNMSISEADEGGFSISAVPGAGLGVVNCGCSKSSSYKSTISSPDGHTRFFNDLCYDLEPGEKGKVVVDGVERNSRSLMLHAKCTACCTCGMFESIVNDRLSKLFDSVKDAKKKLGTLLDSYENAVAKFNMRMRNPSKEDFVMSLSGMPIGKNISPKLSGGSVAGKMSRCAFTAVVRNGSFFTASFTLSSLSGTDSIVEASASWSGEDGRPKSKTGDSKGSLIGSVFSIHPGGSLVVTFVSVKDEMMKKVTTGGFSGSISVSVSCAGKSIGTITRTVSV